MNARHLTPLAFSAALLLGAAAAPAQTASAPSGTAATATATAPAAGSRPVDRSDRKFVDHAAQGGMAEVELGKLAQQRAADPQVKAFGERMVQDHSKANDELLRIANQKGIPAPAMDHSHQSDADKLAKKSGADFDKAYMKHMLNDHKKDVKMFEKTAKSAKDPDIKDFAARTLPTLQAHLQQAQTTYDAVKGKR